jgi:hypothetical protein
VTMPRSRKDFLIRGTMVLVTLGIECPYSP